MAISLIILTASASCMLGLAIGTTYPEAVSAGCKIIASKTWSTVRETTSCIYAKLMEAMPKKEAKAE